MKLVLPSWLVPASWLPNVLEAEALGWADGVELLCFSFSGADRELFLAELPGLAEAGRRISLSVHLPDPLGAACGELIEVTRPFAVAYVLHPPGADAASWAGLVEAWRERYGDDFLLEYCGAEGFAAAESALPGLPLCADTGRLLLDGLGPARWIGERAERIREIHLHGVSGGRDHRPFLGDEAWLRELKPFLMGYDGRVELELFSLDAAEAAYAALRRCLA